MARGKRRTHPFDSPAKRQALPRRPDPHYVAIDDEPGVSLGLYAPPSGAPLSWRVRVRLPGRRYAWASLGRVDDAEDLRDVLDRARREKRRLTAAVRGESDGDDAAEAARSAAIEIAGAEPADERKAARKYRYEKASPRTYTVNDLLHDHAAALAVEGKSHAGDVRRAADGPLFASIARLPVAEITGAQLVGWRDRLASSAPLRRAKKGARVRLVALPDDADAESRRRRRVRVNRIVADLRAAFSRVASIVTWLPPAAADEFAKLKKFEAVGRGRVRPLDPDEVARLLAAIDNRYFRDFVLGALLTGARVAELARLHVVDYDRAAGKVRFRQTKDEPEAGRVVALSPEGVELFDRLTDKRDSDAPIFESASGRQWTENLHIRPMREAVERAKLSPHPHRATFHNLRDTFACSLLRAGVSLDRVSKILGHSTVQLTEKHYARFAESDLDAAARSLPRFDRTPATVAPIAERRIRGAR